MRYDVHGGARASDIVNNWDEEALARIFRQYGEEERARPIAEAIITRRVKAPFHNTRDLADLVSTVVHRRGAIHPATRVFQALRIVVNDELGSLARTIPEAVKLLRVGGHLAIISFHSIEDRIVKQAFASHPDLCIETKRGVKPSREEVRFNPRSRSATLRVAFKK